MRVKRLRGWRPALLLVAVICGAVFGFSAPALALAPGDFDASFGMGGAVTAQLGAGTSPDSYAYALAQQPDGKIVLAGEAIDSGGHYELLVARLNVDGSFDSSFGTAGKVRTQLGAGASPYSSANSLAVQPDGKVIVGGQATDSGGRHELAVVRLNADGSFDSSFGTAGTVVTQLGAGTNPSSFEGALALQPDGKIVVVGEASDSGGHLQLLVARLNADGSLDSSFGTAGEVVRQLGAGASPNSDAYAVALQGDGKIVVAGQANDGAGNYQLVVARLNGNGGFDSSFGTAGAVVTQPGASANPYANARALAMQPDGKILVAGVATDSAGFDQSLVARFNADGSFDSSFGTAGKVMAQLGAGTSPFSNAYGLALQPDGRIAVAGEARDAAGHLQLVVARLNADASFDSSFGTAGRVMAQLGAGTSPSSSAFALALQPDGKVVLAGAANDSGGHDQVLAARLIGDLPPAPSFGASPDPAHVGQPVAFDASGSIDPDGTIGAYRWSFGDGGTGSGPAAAHAYASPGSYPVTLTVTDDDRLSASTTRTITVTALAVTISPAAGALRLTRVAESHRRWREGSARPQIARLRRPPLGTTFRFSLNERARVRFAFTKVLPGRRVGDRCLPQTTRNRHTHRCLRTVTVGAFGFAAGAGAHTVRFQGRLSARRRLSPGRYTLIITVINPAGQRATASLTFTIVRG